MTKNKVIDLRSALELLQAIDGQLVETNVEVDPMGGTFWCLSSCWSSWNSNETNTRRTGDDI